MQHVWMHVVECTKRCTSAVREYRMMTMIHDGTCRVGKPLNLNCRSWHGVVLLPLALNKVDRASSSFLTVAGLSSLVGCKRDTQYHCTLDCGPFAKSEIVSTRVSVLTLWSAVSEDTRSVTLLVPYSSSYRSRPGYLIPCHHLQDQCLSGSRSVSG